MENPDHTSFYRLIDPDARCIDEFSGYTDDKRFAQHINTKTIKFVEDGEDKCYVMDADKGITFDPRSLYTVIDYNIHAGDSVRVYRDAVNKFLYFSKEKMEQVS